MNYKEELENSGVMYMFIILIAVLVLVVQIHVKSEQSVHLQYQVYYTSIILQ